MGKQCFAALFEIETLQHDDWYDKPGRRTLLSNIQEDMLELINRGEKGGSNLENRLPVDPSDESIRIIGCHSPMREVEILHDHLLHFFEQEETVKPGDILVMTPAIDSYAPYIDAVFGSVEEDIRIPYAIAGRSIQAENSMVDAFFQLLDLANNSLTLKPDLAPVGKWEVDSRRPQSWGCWTPNPCGRNSVLPRRISSWCATGCRTPEFGGELMVKVKNGSTCLHMRKTPGRRDCDECFWAMPWPVKTGS